MITLDRNIGSDPKLQDAIDRALEKLQRDSSTPFGAPTVVNKDYQAKFDNYLSINPTAALTITLPTITASDVGQTITLKNSTSLTNTVTVVSGSGQTIDGNSSVTMTNGYEWLILVANRRNGSGGFEWLRFYHPAPTTTLEDLTDTNISSVSDGEILTYDSGTSKWVNEAIPTEEGYDHIFIGAQAINVQGFTNAPARNASTNSLDFSAATPQVIEGWLWLPSGYEDGTTLYMYIHYTVPTDPSAPNNVARWGFGRYFVEPGDEVPSSFTWSYVDRSILSWPGTRTRLYRTLLGSMSGKTKNSVMYWHIGRETSHGHDTYPGVIQLNGISLAYYKNTRGSASQ